MSTQQIESAHAFLNNKAASYRPDIDGIRAVAVVSVVLYHLNTRFTKGGYLGVDVFFVISGFLIVGIIDRELRAGHFSFSGFYERRVRRIFPAFFVMLALVLIFGFLFMLPDEFEDLGRSAVYATLSASNFLFYTTDSYFGATLSVAPLLHTWSLGVEEQFYLLCPVILFCLHRYAKRAIIPVFAGLAAVSFVSDGLLLEHNPTAAFYLPLPRAWELLCGALLALGLPALRAFSSEVDAGSREENASQQKTIAPIQFDRIGKGSSNRILRKACGYAGLLLVMLAIGFPSENGESSIYGALYACGGTVLLLFAGSASPSIASKLLASPPMVYLGRISYSLYLWHWPLLVMFKLVIKAEPSQFDKFWLFSLSIGLAAISERLIERRFRHPGIGTPKRPRAPLWVAAGTMAAFSVGGLVVVLTGGLQTRFPAEVVRLASYQRHGEIETFRPGTCFLSTDSNDFKYYDAAKCLAKDQARRNFLLLGDSHAAQLWIGLVDAFPDINFMQATVAGCSPLLKALENRSQGKTCRDMLNFAMRDYLPQHKLDGVIVAGRWRAGDEAELRRTIDYLAQFTDDVIVVGPIAEYETPLPRILALSALRHDQTLPARSLSKAPFALDLAMEAAIRRTGARYISMIGAMCPGGECATLAEGAPIQFDYGHLTAEGSRMVAREWRKTGALDALHAGLLKPE